MIEIQGKYNTAKVMTDVLDESSMSQIYKMMNHPAFEWQKVVIQPDVHAGTGSVVGFTSTLGDKVIPNVVGVDVGCSVTMIPIQEKKSWSFEALDKVIRKHVPSGMNVRDTIHKDLKNSYSKIGHLYAEISEGISDVSRRTGQNEDRVLKSLGTLGGGNHFLEINEDKNGNHSLVIHSGSRNFGLQVANYHQKKAIAYREIVDKDLLEGYGKDLAWLEGDDAQQYINDMNIAQKYAELNHLIMAKVIFDEMNWKESENKIRSVHNYIDIENKIIRKGAISAQKDEIVIIPISMAEGSIIARGLGNPEYNFSGPHGAGRLFSRGKAKETLSMDEYKERMSGIWSSCISTGTLDESPMAYKGKSYILDNIKDTVEVIDIIKPVYNFKAS